MRWRMPWRRLWTLQTRPRSADGPRPLQSRLQSASQQLHSTPQYFLFSMGKVPGDLQLRLDVLNLNFPVMLRSKASDVLCSFIGYH